MRDDDGGAEHQVFITEQYAEQHRMAFADSPLRVRDLEVQWRAIGRLFSLVAGAYRGAINGLAQGYAGPSSAVVFEQLRNEQRAIEDTAQLCFENANAIGYAGDELRTAQERFRKLPNPALFPAPQGSPWHIEASNALVRLDNEYRNSHARMHDVDPVFRRDPLLWELPEQLGQHPSESSAQNASSEPQPPRSDPAFSDEVRSEVQLAGTQASAPGRLIAAGSSAVPVSGFEVRPVVTAPPLLIPPARPGGASTGGTPGRVVTTPPGPLGGGTGQHGVPVAPGSAAPTDNRRGIRRGNRKVAATDEGEILDGAYRKGAKATYGSRAKPRDDDDDPPPPAPLMRQPGVVGQQPPPRPSDPGGFPERPRESAPPSKVLEGIHRLEDGTVFRIERARPGDDR